ncbi:MAG TPA: alpha-amylase [Prolixibacteraceae bacterium]|nr:alpha-amylase [Prolixibacteraceae bacterium]
MKSVCLLFQIHQPFRHRRYRFFDIGADHYYYDDYTNDAVMTGISAKCYIPANQLLLKLADKLGDKLKISFSVSGVALDQFEMYAPEVIESFQQLAKTGCVEFLAETYSHSLASLKSNAIFREQVKLHNDKILSLFGQKPRVFRNTEMIYSDQVGVQVAEMGFEGMVTEGAKQVLGWKSPGFLYVNAVNPRLKMLMRNYKLSDDIAFRFSNKQWNEYPLNTDKYMRWLRNLPEKDEIVSLFLSYEAFGERHADESGIFTFLEELLEKIVQSSDFKLSTPYEIIKDLQPVSAVSVPHSISWADEERDLTAWLGNEMQKEAFEKLYSLSNQITSCTDTGLLKDWNYLQLSDHFFYMSTKVSTDGEVHKHFNPFGSPYEAFINYMNVLSDFSLRLNRLTSPANEIEELKKRLAEKELKIKELEDSILKLEKSQVNKNRK